jgi:hypothetical protein
MYFLSDLCSISLCGCSWSRFHGGRLLTPLLKASSAVLRGDIALPLNIQYSTSLIIEAYEI